ncbi:unnamed protein product [Phaedon cochleariae]|uniref:Proteasome assembly chaperone 1 n=1 Tax=Phaedon cochleariae TaxID=80249 RepID=A0A9P0DJ39_PHACE|nr:unnamed protein product [Phaedon cochleariae]
MSSCLFGEIVEPTTRALVNEDIDFPPYVEVPQEWEGNTEVPKEVDTLIFLETDNLNKIFSSCIIHDNKPVCKLKNGGIKIFNVGDDKYIVTFFEEKQFNTGQIVEALSDWIFIAENIYTITTDSICKYQNFDLVDHPSSVIRIISNSSTRNTLEYVQLEPPNLVTGLGSSVLTYCIHMKMRKCTLFIAYMDISPLDFLNSGAILSLLKKLKIKVRNSHIQDNNVLASNLYI